MRRASIFLAALVAAPIVAAAALAETPAAPVPAGAPPKDAVLAHSGSVTLFVDEEDKAADALAELAVAEDGYLAARDQARVTLSVPSPRFGAVWARVLTMGVVAEKSHASRDVAADLQSLRASIAARTTMLDQYLAALQGATNREDLAQFQSATTELVLALESLKGRLRVAEHAAAFATVDVAFQLRRRVRVEPADGSSRFAWLRGLGLEQLSARTRETTWHF
jgi:hypothetical protein